MTIEIKIGPEIIRSYKRLAYTPWHALAEFVDNSTQSYLSNKDLLDKTNGSDEGPRLRVSIEYENSSNANIVIKDNAMGMSEDELINALHIGKVPDDTSGRSEFGLGMKTAACWFGNYWTVRTKKLGYSEAHLIHVDVEQVASGNLDLNHSKIKEREDEHYTIIEIKNLNQSLVGGTIRNIKQFLASMYRVDIREGILLLLWNNETLQWKNPIENGNVHEQDGERCYRDISFDVNGKSVRGWIAILERGSRANAGFSIIRRGRVIKGWPESWRPQSIFGQYEGSNDLVNQRIIGEIILDDFGISHTKDDILWEESEQIEVESRLAEEASDYIEIARSYRRRGSGGQWPSRRLINAAMDIFDEEISSPRFKDIITLDGSIPVELMQREPVQMISSAKENRPNTSLTLEDLVLNVFLSDEVAEIDLYIGIEMTSEDNLNIIINMSHPYVKDLRGSMGVLNHIKSCAYDGIAQWKAKRNWNSDNPQVIRTIKDRLLRIGHIIDDEAASSGEG